METYNLNRTSLRQRINFSLLVNDLQNSFVICLPQLLRSLNESKSKPASIAASSSKTDLDVSSPSKTVEQPVTTNRGTTPCRLRSTPFAFSLMALGHGRRRRVVRRLHFSLGGRVPQESTSDRSELTQRRPLHCSSMLQKSSSTKIRRT